MTNNINIIDISNHSNSYFFNQLWLLVLHSDFPLVEGEIYLKKMWLGNGFCQFLQKETTPEKTYVAKPGKYSVHIYNTISPQFYKSS